MKKVTLEQVLWGLYGFVTLLAIYVWGTQLKWNSANLTAYTVFPLFGLLAFSLMWVHYISGFIRDTWFPGQSTKRSFEITSYMVLALIILHPALLVLKLWQSGYGLPPASYKAYVGASNVIWVMLGTLGLTGLLLFEGKRWFSKKSWWKYVNVINDVAVIFIILHSLNLGRHVQVGWFKYVWWFYIITTLLCIIRAYYLKFQSKHPRTQSS